MRRFPAVRGTGCVWALVVTVGGLAGPPVTAQVPAPLDTMRVVSVPDARAGETLTVDIYLHNADTLAAYAMRLRFDPEAIGPVADTQIVGDDTLITAVVEQLRGDVFEIFAAGIPEPGVLTFAASDLDHDTASLFLPGSGVAARLTWYVVPGAPPMTTALTFENDPVFPASWNTMADHSGTVFTRPTLVDGTVTIAPPCACDWHGDVNLNTVAFEIGDLVLLTNIIFLGVPVPVAPDPLCTIERGDLDCNGAVDVLDVLRMMYLITGDWPFPDGICDPCGGSVGATPDARTGGEEEAIR